MLLKRLYCVLSVWWKETFGKCRTFQILSCKIEWTAKNFAQRNLVLIRLYRQYIGTKSSCIAFNIGLSQMLSTASKTSHLIESKQKVFSEYLIHFRSTKKLNELTILSIDHSTKNCARMYTHFQRAISWKYSVARRILRLQTHLSQDLYTWWWNWSDQCLARKFGISCTHLGAQRVLLLYWWQ